MKNVNTPPYLRGTLTTLEFWAEREPQKILDLINVCLNGMVERGQISNLTLSNQLVAQIQAAAAPEDEPRKKDDNKRWLFESPAAIGSH